uniref:Polyprotein n=1 Tax=Rhizopus microsporus endornavirus 3 TaxID=3156527 RepID=A0AAT9H7X2_9VIRU
MYQTKVHDTSWSRDTLGAHVDKNYVTPKKPIPTNIYKRINVQKELRRLRKDIGGIRRGATCITKLITKESEIVDHFLAGAIPIKQVVRPMHANVGSNPVSAENRRRELNVQLRYLLIQSQIKNLGLQAEYRTNGWNFFLSSKRSSTHALKMAFWFLRDGHKPKEKNYLRRKYMAGFEVIYCTVKQGTGGGQLLRVGLAQGHCKVGQCACGAVNHLPNTFDRFALCGYCGIPFSFEDDQNEFGNHFEEFHAFNLAMLAWISGMTLEELLAIKGGVTKEQLESQLMLGLSTHMQNKSNLTGIVLERDEAVTKAMLKKNTPQVMKIDGAVSDEVYKDLQSLFPEYTIVPTPAEINPHAFHSATRKLLEDRWINRLGVGHLIVDVGGSPARHLKRERWNVHTCFPLLSPLDEHRWVKAKMLMENHATKQLNHNYKNGPPKQFHLIEKDFSRMVCHKKSEQCFITDTERPTKLLFIDSLYDIKPAELLQIFCSHRADLGLACLTLPRETWIQTHGTLMHNEGKWTIKGDLLHMTMSDSSETYVNNIKNVREIITRGMIVSPEITLSIRVDGYVGDHICLEIAAMETKNAVNRNLLRTVWFTSNEESRYFKIPVVNPDAVKIPGRNVLTTQIVKLNARFLDQCLMRLLGNEEALYDGSLIKYAKTQASAVINSSSGQRRRYNISAAGVLDHVCVAGYLYHWHLSKMEPMISTKKEDHKFTILKAVKKVLLSTVGSLAEHMGVKETLEELLSRVDSAFKKVQEIDDSAIMNILTIDEWVGGAASGTRTKTPIKVRCAKSIDKSFLRARPKMMVKSCNIYERAAATNEDRAIGVFFEEPEQPADLRDIKNLKEKVYPNCESAQVEPKTTQTRPIKSPSIDIHEEVWEPASPSLPAWHASVEHEIIDEQVPKAHTPASIRDVEFSIENEKEPATTNPLQEQDDEFHEITRSAKSESLKSEIVSIPSLRPIETANPFEVLSQEECSITSDEARRIVNEPSNLFEASLKILGPERVEKRQKVAFRERDLNLARFEQTEIKEQMPGTIESGKTVHHVSNASTAEDDMKEDVHDKEEEDTEPLQIPQEGLLNADFHQAGRYAIKRYEILDVTDVGGDGLCGWHCLSVALSLGSEHWLFLQQCTGKRDWYSMEDLLGYAGTIEANLAVAAGGTIHVVVYDTSRDVPLIVHGTEVLGPDSQHWLVGTARVLEVEDLRPVVPITSSRNLDVKSMVSQIKQSAEVHKKSVGDVDWIVGPTGRGKTNKVLNELKESDVLCFPTTLAAEAAFNRANDPNSYICRAGGRTQGCGSRRLTTWASLRELLRHKEIQPFATIYIDECHTNDSDMYGVMLNTTQEITLLSATPTNAQLYFNPPHKVTFSKKTSGRTATIYASRARAKEELKPGELLLSRKDLEDGTITWDDVINSNKNIRSTTIISNSVTIPNLDCIQDVGERLYFRIRDVKAPRTLTQMWNVMTRQATAAELIQVAGRVGRVKEGKCILPQSCINECVIDDLSAIKLASEGIIIPATWNRLKTFLDMDLSKLARDEEEWEEKAAEMRELQEKIMKAPWITLSHKIKNFDNLFLYFCHNLQNLRLRAIEASKCQFEKNLLLGNVPRRAEGLFDPPAPGSKLGTVKLHEMLEFLAGEIIGDLEDMNPHTTETLRAENIGDLIYFRGNYNFTIKPGDVIMIKPTRGNKELTLVTDSGKDEVAHWVRTSWNPDKTVSRVTIHRQSLGWVRHVHAAISELICDLTVHVDSKVIGPPGAGKTTKFLIPRYEEDEDAVILHPLAQGVVDLCDKNIARVYTVHTGLQYPHLIAGKNVHVDEASLIPWYIVPLLKGLGAREIHLYGDLAQIPADRMYQENCYQKVPVALELEADNVDVLYTSWRCSQSQLDFCGIRALGKGTTHLTKFWYDDERQLHEFLKTNANTAIYVYTRAQQRRLAAHGIESLRAHKNQGREFDRVILLQPDSPTKIGFDDAYLRSAATRAKQELIVIWKKSVRPSDVDMKIPDEYAGGGKKPRSALHFWLTSMVGSTAYMALLMISMRFGIKVAKWSDEKISYYLNMAKFKLELYYERVNDSWYTWFKQEMDDGPVRIPTVKELMNKSIQINNAGMIFPGDNFGPLDADTMNKIIARKYPAVAKWISPNLELESWSQNEVIYRSRGVSIHIKRHPDDDDLALVFTDSALVNAILRRLGTPSEIKSSNQTEVEVIEPHIPPEKGKYIQELSDRTWTKIRTCAMASEMDHLEEDELDILNKYIQNGLLGPKRTNEKARWILKYGRIVAFGTNQKEMAYATYSRQDSLMVDVYAISEHRDSGSLGCWLKGKAFKGGMSFDIGEITTVWNKLLELFKRKLIPWKVLIQQLWNAIFHPKGKGDTDLSEFSVLKGKNFQFHYQYLIEGDKLQMLSYIKRLRKTGNRLWKIELEGEIFYVLTVLQPHSNIVNLLVYSTNSRVGTAERCYELLKKATIENDNLHPISQIAYSGYKGGRGVINTTTYEPRYEQLKLERPVAGTNSVMPRWVQTDLTEEQIQENLNNQGEFLKKLELMEALKETEVADMRPISIPKEFSQDKPNLHEFERPLPPVQSCSTTVKPPLIMDATSVEAMEFYEGDHSMTEMNMTLPERGKIIFKERDTVTKLRNIVINGPAPVDSRPVLYNKYNSVFQAVSTRLNKDFHIRTNFPNPTAQADLVIETYFDKEKYYAAIEGDSITITDDDIRLWVAKHPGNSGLEKELEQYFDEAMTVKKIDEFNVHTKMETLTKSESATYEEQVARLIVWHPKTFAAIFGEFFNKLKKRMKECLDEPFVYADGLTPIELDSHLTNVPPDCVVYETDMSKQDAHTDKQITKAFSEFCIKLGADPRVMKIWEKSDVRFKIRSLTTTGEEPVMRKTGEAPTAFGNYFTNLLAHAWWVKIHRGRIYKYFGLGDDTLILMKNPTMLDELITRMRTDYNQEAKTNVNEKVGIFCCFLVYNNGDGWYLQPDWKRLHSRFRGPPNSNILYKEVFDSRCQSYLYLLGENEWTSYVASVKNWTLDNWYVGNGELAAEAGAIRYNVSPEEIKALCEDTCSLMLHPKLQKYTKEYLGYKSKM